MEKLINDLNPQYTDNRSMEKIRLITGIEFNETPQSL